MLQAMIRRNITNLTYPFYSVISSTMKCISVCRRGQNSSLTVVVVVVVVAEALYD
jgi:hypothetical protein